MYYYNRRRNGSHIRKYMNSDGTHLSETVTLRSLAGNWHSLLLTTHDRQGLSPEHLIFWAWHL